MKNIALLIISFLQFMMVMLSMRLDQNYLVDSNTSAIWETNYTSAQPQLGSGPSGYVFCGFAFKQMKLQVNVSNCNCRNDYIQQKFQWRCSFCPNVYWTQSNAFKGIFCSLIDWNLKIQKTTETGNMDGGNWRQFRCPKDQYAGRVAVRNTGNEQGTGLGFNGMLMKCYNKNFTQSTIVTDNYNYQLSQISKNKQGNWPSSYKLKYQKNGKLLGIDFGFQGLSQIKMPPKQYKKQLTYAFSLNNNDVWSNFPDLNLYITVEQPKRYFIQYNVQTMRTAGAPGYFCTKLLMNDKQLTEFRATTGDTRHHSNQASSFIYLQAGTYKIEVKYRTNGQFRNHQAWDWSTNVLKVAEF